jgi:transmembrane sensor
MDTRTIEATAARWLLKREAAAWTAGDQSELDSWLNESTLHRVAFIRLHAVWQQMARLKALGAGVPAGVIPSAGYWNIGGKLGDVTAAGDLRRDRRWRYWHGLAAGLALSAMVAVYLFFIQIPDASRYSTPVGGLETITLQDGSRITLNTNTTLRVHLGSTARRIDLEAGEAYFVVASDPARPFAVFVTNKHITATGTEFSARRNANELQVIVTHGRVQLTAGGQSHEPTSLELGTVARTSGSDVLVHHASEGELDGLLSWRDGFIVFQGTSLNEAVAEFNRYHARKIVIADPSIGAIKISGRFRPANAEAFLWLLQHGFPVSVERRADHIVLRRHV